jgi:hypothetical protein
MEAWLRLLVEVLIFFFCSFLSTFLMSLTFSLRDFVHAMVVPVLSFFTMSSQYLEKVEQCTSLLVMSSSFLASHFLP